VVGHAQPAAGPTAARPAAQRFVATFPAARKVQLVGSFSNWEAAPVEMTRAPDGTWTAEIRLEPGQYEYRFLVDGSWADDPGSSRVPNPYGSQNNVCTVVAMDR
jgi:1,4-alpha-glucan branching enzyme